VITPWNFPFAIPSWKIAPRSLRKTPVRLQSRARTRPLLAERFVELLADAGLPAGA